ncbi:MAG: purine-nucleoside phosphorylase [Rhodospirillaceae bacterium]|jgi:purine-nucleoside phosphorylase|nr:purine-nucleoside phosphorylase [Rhodospirillaceae bacterium]MBT5192469.1 purine-nucleoside phosphorylase [Rhodospirillaceae bacterium]MBT5897904.1 purine-nucleoside phosphorylase [Rhodospirillaceae bacterium]MBT6429197.1 purine-nucleoside phosphorylase [Rhodospirillaceae bacterium]MBT7760426.1 purine-nucleoside phosphorylase [Rhodospirillaceae bacterium]
MIDQSNQALAVITKRHPDFRPKVAVVLGSGLGGLAAHLDAAPPIPYDALPGFPKPGVSGHQGQLILASAGDTPVALLEGRAHLYEDGRADAMAVAVRTMAGLGCEALVLTNAAGGLDPDMEPGSVMLLTDHLNFTGQSPLFGLPGDDRFVDMTQAYDLGLRHRLLAVAAEMDLPLHQGVYAWFAGPQFETVAEVRAAGILGANAVGMSTVPEVILARHAGMRVAGLSIITNKAAGMSDFTLSHEQTKRNAALATDQVQELLATFLKGYGG